MTELTPEAGVRESHDAIRPMWGWLRPQARRLTFAAVLGTLAIGCGVGLLATSGWLISRASQQPPIVVLGVAIVAVRAFGIGRGVLRYAERLVSHDTALRSLSALRLAVYHRLTLVAPGGVPAYRRGDLLERMVHDVDTTQDLPLRVVLPYVSGAAVSAGTVVLAWWLLPAAGVVLLVSLLLAATLVPWLTAQAAATGESDTAAARGQHQADVVAFLDALPEIIAVGAQQDWLNRLGDDERQVQHLARRSAWATGRAGMLAVLLTGGAALAMLLVAVPAVARGSLPAVALAVLVLLPLATHEAVSSMPGAALALGRVRGAADRVDSVLQAPDPVPDPVDPAPTSDGYAHRAPALRVRGLRARWSSGPEVLHGIDFDVSAGSHVTIAGPSGAGKSTLLAVLARFLPYEGSITLDGTELQAIAGGDVRQVVGWCPQEPHLFDTSIAENLRFVRPGCSDEQIRKVLDAVGLGPWLDTLPAGLQTGVGEHGSQVSGGQRHRLGVARVLLAGHPLVLLDEPTEHLDEATAAVVTGELLQALAGRTVLWVTHQEDPTALTPGCVVQVSQPDARIR